MSPSSQQIRVWRCGFSFAGSSTYSYNRAKSSIEAEAIGVEMFKGSKAPFKSDSLKGP